MLVQGTMGILAVHQRRRRQRQVSGIRTISSSSSSSSSSSHSRMLPMARQLTLQPSSRQQRIISRRTQPITSSSRPRLDGEDDTACGLSSSAEAI